ncbi:glycosyltransferase family 4 protein [Nocardiopsis coralliicola]
MHVLVATVVHHPEDARILHRQIRALLDAGHEVTYIAPFRERRVAPWPELTAVDVPRAAGRRRLRALRAARAAIAEHAEHADVLLFHDPELMLALPRRRAGGPAVVWDVHEDAAAALLTKPWLPQPLRRPLGPVVRSFERRAESAMHLLLAEDGYRDRFRLDHPVVPNTTRVPERPGRPPGHERVVYLGHLSEARGAREIVALGRRLRPHGIRVDVIGPADEQVRGLLRDAQREGAVHWYGFVPNDQALRIAAGALAGVSLLHDTPNYRHSLPTKVVEYMAHGLPVITTPSPVAEALVAGRPEGPCGIVVPFGDAAEASRAALLLRRDSALRARFARVGHAIARGHYHWPTQAPAFVSALERWAAQARSAPAAPAPVPAQQSRRQSSHEPLTWNNPPGRHVVDLRP